MATVTRNTAKDIDLGPGNWSGGASDGTTLWFTDNDTQAVVAYVAATRARDSAKDIDLGPGNWSGGASDGTTLWFTDNSADVAEAYVAATRARDSAKDIALGEGSWQGGASDGTTLWFVDNVTDVAVAYVVATRARDSAKDIALGPGIWLGGVSDGTTLWFVDNADTQAVVAYVAATRARDSDSDVIHADLAGVLAGAVYANETVWFVEPEPDSAIAFDVAPPTGSGTAIEAEGSLGEATGQAIAAVVVTGSGTAIEAEGSLGEATGQASPVATLTLSDWSLPAGRTQEAAALITAGNELYYAGVEGSLDDGELTLDNADITINRIRSVGSGAQLTLNKSGADSWDSILEGTTPPYADFQIHLQYGDQSDEIIVLDIDDLDDAGGSFARFTVPSADQGALDGIGNGERFIFALTRAAIAAVVVTGSGTAIEAEGSLGEATGQAIAAVVVTGSGTAIEAEGSLGEATGQASPVATLTLSDWSLPAGRTQEAAALITAGNELYYAGVEGSLDDGELTLDNADITINRIRSVGSGAQLTLNKSGADSWDSILEGTTPPYADFQIHLQYGDQSDEIIVLDIDDLDDAGGSFARFTVPSADQGALDGIGNGERFIFALTRAAIAAGVVTGSGTAIEAEGSLGEATGQAIAAGVVTGSGTAIEAEGSLGEATGQAIAAGVVTGSGTAIEAEGSLGEATGQAIAAGVVTGSGTAIEAEGSLGEATGQAIAAGVVTGSGTAIEAEGSLGEATGQAIAAGVVTGSGTAIEAEGSLGEATGQAIAAGVVTGSGTAIEAEGSLGEATGQAIAAGVVTGSGTAIEAEGSLGEATGQAIAAGVVTGSGTAIEAEGSLGEATGQAIAAGVVTGSGTAIEAEGSLGEATGSAALFFPADRARIAARALEGADEIHALEITHPGLTSPVRIVNDTADHTVEGNTFLACSFEPQLPQEVDGQVRRASIRVDNIGRKLMEWIELSEGGKGAYMRILALIPPGQGEVASEISYDVTMGVVISDITHQSVTVEVAEDSLVGRSGILLRHDPGLSPGLF